MSDDNSQYYYSLFMEAKTENERLRRVELAAGNLDRYSLVIQSAVQASDPGNADAVALAILRLRDAMGLKLPPNARAALAKAQGGGT